MPVDHSQVRIHISITDQSLRLLENKKVLLEAQISTAANGAGEQEGSECTPRGQHRICARIGHRCEENTVFIGRHPTGELYTPELRAQYQDRDWILTRILWLGGLESGVNRGGNVDSMRRYIYIHDTPDEESIGTPGSRGCVRMHNDVLIELYQQVRVGTRVLIEA